MNEPKRHHYVNKAYLEHFLDPTTGEGEQFWLADSEAFRIRKAHPVAVAKTWHYYSIRNPDGTYNTAVEKFLAGIEGAAEPVMQKLMLGGPTLTQVEREELCIYLAMMNLRVPSFRDRVEDFHARSARIVLSMMMAKPGRLESIAKKARAELADGVTFGQIREWYRKESEHLKVKIDPVVSLRPLLEQGPMVAQFLYKMHMTLLGNPTGLPLITSDNPVCVHNPLFPGGAAGLAQQYVEITFPISPSVALLFAHRPNPPFLEMDRAAVWEMNSRVVGGHDRFLFTSDWWAAFQCLEGIDEGERIERQAPWNRLWPQRHRLDKERVR